jgi:hypothetical protein
VSEAEGLIASILAWDRANTDRYLKAQELARMKENARKKCGNCAHWMRSMSCPKEVHDMRTGRYSGPSCNGYPCDKFKSSWSHERYLREYEEALNPKKDDAPSCAGKEGGE